MNTQSLASILPPEMTELRVRPLFIFDLQVKPATMVGTTPAGDRRIGEIVGGRFEGERLRGKILSGGSDWQSLRTDGNLALDVRFVMETHDGHLIGMTYKGMRHGPKEVMDRIARGDPVSPSEYYLRIAPYFETSSEKYGWINRLIGVGLGHRLPSGPIYQVFEIL
jgi:hypothetical protein